MAKRKQTKGQTTVLFCLDPLVLLLTKLKNHLSFQSFDLSVPEEG
jgi:hypothetical protein